jgi:hypothetical protein
MKIAEKLGVCAPAFSGSRWIAKKTEHSGAGFAKYSYFEPEIQNILLLIIANINKITARKIYDIEVK